MSNKAQHPSGEVIWLKPLPDNDPNREPTAKELADLMALPKPSWEELERLGRDQQQDRSQANERGMER